MESATENIPPKNIKVRVKRWCKRPPVFLLIDRACKPLLVQDRIGSKMLSASLDERVGCSSLLEILSADK